MITNPVKLKAAANNIEAELIINLLHNNNIACYKKSKGSGGYMNIYMGYSVYGEDIYVDKSDYEKATTLLYEITTNNELILEEDELDFHTPFYKNPRIVARILLFITLGGMLLTFILNVIY